jgi:hypothetical protein
LYVSQERTNNLQRKATASKTSVCPAWLHLSQDGELFQIYDDKAAIVRSIYEDSAAGIGDHSITRRLNEQSIPPFGKSDGWQKSYVTKILSSRSVLGEFQPHQMSPTGKRLPVGDVITDYYPRIVSDELFLRAWHARVSRRETGRGRKGKGITSLFSGLLKCAYCDSTIVLENKGPPPKGGLYVVCERAKRGLSCSKLRWRYRDFEASFLAFVQEIDLQVLVAPGASHQPLAKHIATLRARIASLEEKRDGVIQLISTVKHKERLGVELDSIEESLISLREDVRKKELEQLRLASAEKQFVEGKAQIKRLIDKLQDVEHVDDLYLLRSNTSARIKNLIDRIFVAAEGSVPTVRNMIADERGSEAPNARRIADLEVALEGERTKQAYFTVVFKDGTTRIVAPSKDDALLLTIRGDGSAEEITRTAPEEQVTVVKTRQIAGGRFAFFGEE